MTKREFLNAAIVAFAETENVENEQYIIFAQEEIAKMDKKNAERTSKQSKKTIENLGVREAITNVLFTNKVAMTAEEIATELNITTSKASSLASRMATEGMLVKTDKKVKGKGTRKAYTIA